ncbi:hypothetical protein GCM10027088_01590 [Nocardia goodfellowii]
MGGIDDGIDLVVRQPLSQTLGSPETADAHRTGGQEWVANASGERGNDIESSLAGRAIGQFPGFPGPAQNQDVQGCPLK